MPKLKARYPIKSWCHVTIKQKDKEPTAIQAFVIAVHFYESKVKYDLDIPLEGDLWTRIYNVDSILLED